MKRTLEQYRNEYYAINSDHTLSWRESETKKQQLTDEWYHEMDVGDHANVKMYTDVDPVTIIKKTATTLTVRYDKARRDPNWKPEWVEGGFSAVCLNDDKQKWIIEPDLDGRVETFRWHKNEHCYMNNGCKLRPGWNKYYDYNF